MRRIRCILVAIAVSCLSAGASAQCRADFDANGAVNGADLGLLLSAWGTCGSPCPRDLDANGVVGGSDLGILLGAWGECPPAVVPAWATLIEPNPDPAVVTSASLRAAIRATGLAWRVRDSSSQVEMLLVPPGTFQRGCSASLTQPCFSDELPVRAITVSAPFYVGRRELTQSQWRAVMGDNPSQFRGPDYPEDLHPVETLSWDRVAEFNARTGLRMLTEAEWEYAFRAGTSTAYHGYSGVPNGTNAEGFVTMIAWHEGNSGAQTRPVGQKLANGFGLHDMAGNVAEFVSDWFGSDYFGSCPAVDPPGPASGTHRVVRGGHMLDAPIWLRSSVRFGAMPAVTYTLVGVRVARDP